MVLFARNSLDQVHLMAQRPYTRVHGSSGRSLLSIRSSLIEGLTGLTGAVRSFGMGSIFIHSHFAVVTSGQQSPAAGPLTAATSNECNLHTIN
ncbi:hypothetical protein SCLCIDRAFT_435161 [Scleroderma citrinum Foug A]|uniref:Uncharacterized protein n=1 Tax=Scleroderma citrinum Foug A TaxID=1036808 RepID=A0A0C2ZLA9_9AGAM|nr:hypothetical protein SCLCIDRAFT_435161 [Scleroderma citrinum Foug A]